MNEENVLENIRMHEGWRARPYPDPLTGGEPYTFGYGFTRLTREEGEWILRRRVREIVDHLQHLHEFAHAPEGVQEVLVEMAYQMGISGLILFKRMFAAIAEGDYARAAEEILNSRLARQTPARARNYAKRMREAKKPVDSGKWAVGSGQWTVKQNYPLSTNHYPLQLTQPERSEEGKEMSVRLASRGQKALIHIAKKELGLSESLYRATLFQVCGKESAAELTGPEAKRLIDFFEKMGFSPRKKEKKKGFYRDFSDLPEDRDPWASPGQLKLIYKLWARISRAKDKQVALRRFVFRLARVSDPTFLTFRQAGVVIEALKKMDARENGSTRH